MNIKDRVSFTHSFISKKSICGYYKRGLFNSQYPGDIKRFGIFYYIKRGKNVVQI